jgi:hypothetical protein
MNSVKERLQLFIMSLQISQREFERLTGLPNGLVCNIRRYLTPESLNKIKNTFPELSIGWLLSGEGQMILSNKDCNDERLMKIIEFQQKTIDRLTK